MIKSSDYDPNKCYKKEKLDLSWSESRKIKQITNKKDAIRLWVYHIPTKSKEYVLAASFIDKKFNFSKSTTSHIFLWRKNDFKYGGYLISKTEYDENSDELINIYNKSYEYIPKSNKNKNK